MNIENVKSQAANLFEQAGFIAYIVNQADYDAVSGNEIAETLNDATGRFHPVSLSTGQDQSRRGDI